MTPITGFKKRLTEVWIYPQICKYQDKIDNVSHYLRFLDSASTNKEVLIYIHIPFCEGFCFYCSYYKTPLLKYSYEERKEIFAAYKTEIENYARKNYFKDTFVKAIQFGGGTPSSVEPEFIEQLIKTLQDNFNTEKCEMISMEGNVLSLQDPVKLKALKARGVKRFSFGVQTFNERIRKKLGIRAKISDIFKAVEAIKEADFKDYSLDIMYNLPEQTMEDIANDLEMVERLNPIYVDAYNLNIFPNTKFKEVIDRGNYFSSKPSDENEIAMFKEIMSIMKRKKYKQVMVNTFSKYNERPVITLDMYLNGSNVIGIGPSARSYFKRRNYRNIPSIEEYVKKIDAGEFPVAAGNVATPDEQMERKMVFFPIYTYIKKSEINHFEHFASRIQFLIEKGYAEDDGTFLRLTDEGKVWPGNISTLFFNQKQRRKNNISFLNAYKHKENPYNQDKMGISIAN